MAFLAQPTMRNQWSEEFIIGAARGHWPQQLALFLTRDAHYLADLGGDLLNGFMGGRDVGNIVIEEGLLGLLHLFSAGREFGVGTAGIPFFPHLVQNLRGGGEADGPIAVINNLLGQAVKAKIFRGQWEIGRFDPHLGRQIDADRGFAGPGDPDDDEFCLVILLGFGAVVMVQAVMDGLHPFIHPLIVLVVGEAGGPQGLGLKADFQLIQEKGEAVKKFHLRAVKYRPNLRGHDGGKNNGAQARGLLHYFLKNLLGVINRLDEGEGLFVEGNSRKLAGKGLAEGFNQDAG